MLTVAQVRGLVMSDEQEGSRSRRVSGANLATALDDDVASLLAGLDNTDTSQVGSLLEESKIFSDLQRNGL